MVPLLSAEVYVTAGSGISPALLLEAVIFSDWDSPPPAVIPVRLTVCSGSSSVSDRSGAGSRVGASLTGTTVIRNVRVTFRLSEVVAKSSSSPASSRTTVIVAEPLRLVEGVKSSEPVAFGEVYWTVGSGIRAELLLDAVIRSSCDSEGPAEIPCRFTVCSGASSLTDKSAMLSISGASFTLATLTTKEWLTLRLSPAVFRLPSRPPSSTVTVMVAEPFWLATGVKRIDPVLPGDE